MIDHPEVRAGALHGNPVYEDIVEAARIGGARLFHQRHAGQP